MLDASVFSDEQLARAIVEESEVLRRLRAEVRRRSSVVKPNRVSRAEVLAALAKLGEGTAKEVKALIPHANQYQVWSRLINVQPKLKRKGSRFVSPCSEKDICASSE